MTWHFPICSDGARRTRRVRLPSLLAALLKSPLRLLLPVALLKLLLLAALLKLPPLVALPRSPQRPPLPAVLLKLLPLVALLTSRKKSPLPVASATSNRFFPPKSVPGGKDLTGNLVYYSVLPIYDRNNKCKVTMT